MTINSGAINSSSINSASGVPGGDESLNNLASLVDALSSYVVVSLAISDGLLVTDATGAYYDANGSINDFMYWSDSNLSSMVTSISIIDAITIVDRMFVVMNELLAELVAINDTANDIVQKIAVINEKISALHSLASKSLSSNTLIDIITVGDSTGFGILKAITEVISLADTMINKLIARPEISENIIVIYSLGEAARIFRETSELFVVSDTVNNQSIIEQILTDYVSFSVGIQKDLDSIAYLLSPETMSVSTYTNFNFKKACVFNDVPLFANDAGLYSYGGDTDDGASIEASIKTAALSFGTPHLKRVLNLYLGLYNSDTIVLKASADGNETAYYQVSEASQGIQTQRMTLGKGMVGRYWQFELITQNNTIFELESLDFLPVSLSRRI